ncbi:MAG: DMT family transporter [Dehalobacterium sp.]
MHKYYYGVVMVLLSAFGFALMPTFAKFAYKNDVTVMTLLIIRFSLAAMVFFSYLILTKQNLRLDKRNILGLFFLGAVCYTLQSAFYFSAVKYIPASLVVLITYTHPTIIAVISCFLDHEPITKIIAFSLISSFVGLTLMLGTALGNINGLGIMLATGASLVYSVYVVLGNKMLKKVPPLIASAFIALFTSLGLLLFGILSDGISFGFQKAAWPWIIGLVAFSTVIAMLTFFRGLEVLGPTKATILSTAEPVFGVTIAIILFHERLNILQFLGAAGVITGAVMAVHTRDKVKQEQKGG